ncbi:MAG: CTP synthase [Acidilobaceae archaeon]|nr:CTP synthase [Acidilobaceae archaeon]
MRYIFVTGGVLSSVGKGIVSASIGLLIASRGYAVSAVKIDPYINVDAGTMNPYAHGEVFVTEDGGETDLDLGHYERFLDVNLSKKHNITTGQVYMAVITKERRGDYLGQTVQVIPHVTEEVKSRLRELAKGVDLLLVEIGGTVGDIEGLPFLEAARQMRLEEGAEGTLFVHVALAPELSVTGEQKTKPVQHSVQELRRIGIQPDIIVVRSRRPLEAEARRKIALHATLPESHVFSSYDLDNIYALPLILEEQGLGELVSRRLRLEGRPRLEEWRALVERMRSSSRRVEVAMVGKYTKLRDSYLSIVEALKHAGAHLGVRPELRWVEATEIEEGRLRVEEALEGVRAAIVLPGFGRRGVEGKIAAIRYLRENRVPTLGICFGLQLAVVEAARNLLGLEGAHTTEVNPETPYPVVDLLPQQRNLSELGGTMRLGASPVALKKGTLAFEVYGREVIVERHRHRYEVNEKFLDKLEGVDFIASGHSPEGLVEVMEYRRELHPFFLGLQPHPEFKSRPLRPSPPFMGLLARGLSM